MRDAKLSNIFVILAFSSALISSWSGDFNQHFPMAATLAALTAEIAFFLKIRHSAFYCPFRFTNSGSKLLLRDGGICYHGL